MINDKAATPIAPTVSAAVYREIAETLVDQYQSNEHSLLLMISALLDYTKALERRIQSLEAAHGKDARPNKDQLS